MADPWHPLEREIRREQRRRRRRPGLLSRLRRGSKGAADQDRLRVQGDAEPVVHPVADFSGKIQ